MLDNSDVLSYVLPIRVESPVSAEIVDYLQSLPVFRHHKTMRIKNVM